MEYAVLGCRAVLGVVFLMSAWSKIRDVAGFADTVQVIAAVRSAAASALARLVIAAETAVAVTMVSPWRLVAAVGFAVALGLALVFAFVLASALRRGVVESCRCFGRWSGRRPVGVTDVPRDLVLATVAGVGLAGVIGGGVAGAAAQTGGLVVAGAAGAVAGIVLIVLDDIVGLFVPERETGKEAQWPSSVSR